MDEATLDFVYGYEHRRLNLACRIVVAVQQLTGFQGFVKFLFI